MSAIFSPCSPPEVETWSTSTVISESSGRTDVEITAGAAAVFDVFSPESMVSLVENMLEPSQFISTSVTPPPDPETDKLALTSVTSIGKGILKVYADAVATTAAESATQSLCMTSKYPFGSLTQKSSSVAI